MEQLHSSCFVNFCAMVLAMLSLASSAETINFSGQLDVIDDSSGAVYSGATTSTNFSGNIDDVTANGSISDGATVTSFGCCIAAGGFSITNNEVLDASSAAFLNSIIGSSTFSAGDVVDTVDIEGDATTAGGGRIEVGLNYILDGNTFSNTDSSNYPFKQDDLLLALFFIVEEDINGDTIFDAVGQLDPVPPPVATYLAPGWVATNFMSLEIPTRAIAFDSSKNLYIENTGNDNSGRIEVLQLTAASGYQNLSGYASYSTNYKGATGLGFDRLGNLYIAERSVDGDAGIIRKIDVATQKMVGNVMSFASHRPTGVDADTSGNIFYSGRKESAGAWGKIFKIDTNTIPAVRTELILDTVATGFAMDTSGNIFISTPKRTDLPLLSNSIYRFAANDILKPELIATFDARGGELTIDTAGNLYMVAGDEMNIIKLSRIATKAMPWLPLLLE